MLDDKLNNTKVKVISGDDDILGCKGILENTSRGEFWLNNDDGQNIHFSWDSKISSDDKEIMVRANNIWIFEKI